MKDHEWLQIVQALVRQSKRQTIPLQNIGEWLSYKGYVDDGDTATRGEAVAAFVRHLLADDAIQHHLRLVQEHRLLYALIAVINHSRVPAVDVGDGTLRQLHQRAQVVNDEMMRHRPAVSEKIAIIHRLLAALKGLPSQETVDLPEVVPSFPSLPSATSD